MLSPKVNKLFVLVYSFFLCGCLNGGHTEQGSPNANVILIVMDTVRADHLSLYGYDRRTSPNLDRLGRISTVCSRAYATGPWTLPSHASLFTGLYSFEHEARAYPLGESVVTPAKVHRRDRSDASPGENQSMLQAVNKTVVDNANKLGSSYLTLAEAFREFGYQTCAINANNYYLNTRFGLDQGFQTFESRRRSGIEITDRALKWLDERNKVTPFFLFLNYMDAHRPYNTHPVPGLFNQKVPEDSGSLLDKVYEQMIVDGESGDTLMLGVISNQYDMGIANLDLALGILLKHLCSQGLFENSLIIVTSDHGEYLGEHGLIEHRKDIYEQTMHVPMLIKYPYSKDMYCRNRLISLVDMPDIIFRTVSLPAPAEMRKHSDKGNLVIESYYSSVKDLESNKDFDRIRQGVISKNWKYIRSSDGRNELYDLAGDPSEANNLLHIGPEDYDQVSSQLDEILPTPLESEKPRNNIELTDKEIQELKALGYL